MATKKITETPDFVKGLLKSADQIDKLLNPTKMHPRVLLDKLRRGQEELADLSSDERQELGMYQARVVLADLSSDERQELGMYQARVVLIVLALELALKLLWERDKGREAPQNHKINKLFGELCPSRQSQIKSEYCKLAGSPPSGWETPDKIFELCKDASVQWRYLVEKSNFPKYVMQAKYLKYATLSVLRVVSDHPNSP